MGMGVCRRNGTPEASTSAAPGPGTSGVLRDLLSHMKFSLDHLRQIWSSYLEETNRELAH